MRRRIFKKSVNKKVRNANPNTHDGIRFKSNLETYIYKLFKKAGINLRYEQKTYELVPAFIYQDKKFRKMTITPDFTTDDELIVIEAKGFPNDVFPVKWKLLNYRLLSEEKQPRLFLITKQSEANAVLETVLSIINANSKPNTNI